MKDSSANVGRLFSRILSRHLEDVKIDVNKLEDSLTIDDLIEWEIWPTMLKIYNGKPFIVYTLVICLDKFAISRDFFKDCKCALLKYSVTITPRGA